MVIPPTRHDILHECDIVEDVGVAYGFNKLELRLPSVGYSTFFSKFLTHKIFRSAACEKSQNSINIKLQAHTVATPLPLNSVSDHLRIGLSNAGFTEALNFALCSK